MPSAAQIQAKANFKKAIAYRKKHNCSLKEAFAAVYPKKKVAGYVKTLRKGTKTDVIYSKAAKPTKAAKPIQQKLFGVKKKAAKKPVSSHKDTKSHNVNIRVVSGIGDIHKANRTIAEQSLEKMEKRLEASKDVLKNAKTALDKKNARKYIATVKSSIALLKLIIKEHNKKILQ